MSTQPPNPPARPPGNHPPADRAPMPTVTANLRFSAGGIDIAAPMTVPAGAAYAETALPALQLLVNRAVEGAEKLERASGRQASCRMGCAACCRHLVPVSRTEARALAALVAVQSPQRRADLRAHFAAAAEKLLAAGLAPDWLDHAARATIADRVLSVGYFAQHIACPFLENEACSIYADRPLACRELKVSSPAENCANPEQEGVVPLPVPKFSVAVRGLEADDTVADTTGQWMPLILALEWAEKEAGKPRKMLPGPEWIQRFLRRLRISN